jgi:hypothetical protein
MILDFCNDSSVFRPALICVSNGGRGWENIFFEIIKCVCGWMDGCMQKLDFKFPLTVSTVHFICSTIGAHIAIKVLQLKPLIEVNPADRWSRILPMSFIFCLNIVLGNVSLRYIPVSFMQTIKSFTPATTGALASSPSPSPIFSSVLQFTKVWLISAIQNNTGLSM